MWAGAVGRELTGIPHPTIRRLSTVVLPWLRNYLVLTFLLPSFFLFHFSPSSHLERNITWVTDWSWSNSKWKEAIAPQTSKLLFSPLEKAVDLLKCPDLGRSRALEVFVSYVQVASLAFGLAGKWVTCKIHVNKLMHPVGLPTFKSRKPLSYFISRHTTIKIDMFETFFFPS